MANVPGSPEDTSATVQPAPASAQAWLGPLGLGAHRRPQHELIGAQQRRHRVDVGPVAEHGVGVPDGARRRPGSGARPPRARARRPGRGRSAPVRARADATAAVAVAPAALLDHEAGAGAGGQQRRGLGDARRAHGMLDRVRWGWGRRPRRAARPGTSRPATAVGPAVTAGWSARRSMVATATAGSAPAGRGGGQRLGDHGSDVVGRRALRAADADDEAVAGARVRPWPPAVRRHVAPGHEHRVVGHEAHAAVGQVGGHVDRHLGQRARAGPGRPAPGRPPRTWRRPARRGGRPPRQASSTSSPPPPTKTRSGAGRSASASGAAPVTTSTSAPRTAALATTVAAAAGSRSTATTRRPGAASAASMPTLPLPAPTSHSTPWSGSVETAQHDRAHLGLRDHPSPVGEVLDRPPAGADSRRDLGRASPVASVRQNHDRPVVELARRQGGDVVEPGHASPGSPSRVATATRSGWAPSSDQRGADRLGRRRRPAQHGGDRRRRRPRRRPGPRPPAWHDATTASSHGRPRRAKARATDDGAGCTTRRSRPRRAASARVMPWNPGSPDASTQARSGVGGHRVEGTEPGADRLDPGTGGDQVGHGRELVAAARHERGGGQTARGGVLADRAPAQQADDVHRRAPSTGLGHEIALPVRSGASVTAPTTTTPGPIDGEAASAPGAPRCTVGRRAVGRDHGHAPAARPRGSAGGQPGRVVGHRHEGAAGVGGRWQGVRARRSSPSRPGVDGGRGSPPGSARPARPRGRARSRSRHPSWPGWRTRPRSAGCSHGSPR